MRKLIIVGLITFVPIWVSAQKAFKNWPEGVSCLLYTSPSPRD